MGRQLLQGPTLELSVEVRDQNERSFKVVVPVDSSPRRYVVWPLSIAEWTAESRLPLWGWIENVMRDPEKTILRTSRHRGEGGQAIGR